MLSIEQSNQVNEILEELGKNLDITQSEYDTAVKSYEAVGEQLIKDNSQLIPYKPKIKPQGSFMLGTMIRPVNEDGDLDIDLVCELTRKKDSWTQKDVKEIVGDQIKDNLTYKRMLKEQGGGRRCWTLVYANEKYHLDILPCIVSEGYETLLESKQFSALSFDNKNVEDLAIRITDKEMTGYTYLTETEDWLKSNPFGYAKWFFHRAVIEQTKLYSLNESIERVRSNSQEKLPLQRAIQLLKRHRDIMFGDDEDKPISIIITTLAAQAYNKEKSPLEALSTIVKNMENGIEWRKWNPKNNRYEVWVTNPVNNEENFADKWADVYKKRENFVKWLDSIKALINDIRSFPDLKLDNLNEKLRTPFGETLVNKTFSSYGNLLLEQRESNKMKMAATTGILGSTGRTNVPQHKPFGKNE